MGELKHPLRSHQVPQSVLTKVDQPEIVGKRVSHKVSGHL
jgi:hypothetical protein